LLANFLIRLLNKDEMNIQVSGYDNDAQEQINLSNSFDDESDINEESKGK